MVAVSKQTDKHYKPAEYPCAIRYTPPEGEALADLTISAVLVHSNREDIPADTLTFDRATGAIKAVWQEETVKTLGAGQTYEVRMMRDLGGETRVFYVRRVQVL